MKIAYRPVVTYTYSKRKKAKEKNKITTRGCIPHKTKELAEREAESIVSRLNEEEKLFEAKNGKTSNLRIFEVTIEEFEIEDEVRVLGEVNCGGEYEDAFVNVGEKDINSILEGYDTRKVEVIIRVID